MTTPVGGASVFGGIGKLEYAPQNAPDDPSPYYADITQYVRTEQTDLAIARGRDSELNAFQPGQLTCLLDNTTGLFTPGGTPHLVISDKFNRTVANGWGTADTGQAWTATGGSAADFSVAGGFGQHSNAAVSTAHFTTVGAMLNANVYFEVTISVVALGGNYDAGDVIFRFTDANNFYQCHVIAQTSGQVGVGIGKVVAGSFTTLASQVSIGAYSAGTVVKVRAQILGGTIAAKAWLSGTPEPTAWTVTANDSSFFAALPVGVKTQLPGSNTNTLPVTMSIDNLQVFDPLLVPLAPAMPVRYSETIGSRTFVLFKGWIEYPDITNWQPIGYQEVQLTATDRLARLARGRTFVSTLAEHILYVGQSAGLMAYYPLNDPAAPFQDRGPNNYPPVTAAVSALGGVPAAALSGTAGWTAGSQAGPPGDDVSTLAVTMQVAGTHDNADVHLTADFRTPGRSIPIPSGQTLTVVGWFNADPSQACATIATMLVAQCYQANGVQYANLTTAGFDASGTTDGGNWFASVSGASDLVGTKAVGSHWLPIAVRMTWSTLGIEFWQADQPAQTGTMVLTPPTDLSLGQLQVTQEAYQGQIAHVQVYVGTTYTRAMFLAQMQMGLLGMESQTTGQRVNTILNYAGVSATDRQVDPGVSYMAKATLAGRAPADVLAEAVTAEQGRGFALGAGPYAFHDRQRVMNV